VILTNKLNLPQPFVDAATNDHEYTEGRYSVTELLGGTCEAILKRRHADDIEEDVSDRVWAILGTAVHEILRQAEASESQIQENWLSVKLEGLASGYELSGIFDLYDDSTGTVTDYKNAVTIKWQKQDFEDYRMQTLLYCWLLQQIGFAAWNGEIVMILRDWSKGKAKFDKDYPQKQVQRVSFHFSDKDMEEAEEFVYMWFIMVKHEEAVPDDCLEPCTPEQRWHKTDKWAVKKKGRKTAVRVYESEKDARVRAMEENKKADSNDLYYVEFREGEDTRCQSYCSVAQFCPYGRKFFQES
jgi:hypothetical protein